ncbi:hypothetical protein V6N13_064097 [Hibiscus sabdariffa]
MWAIRAWLPGSPWSIHRVGDASYSVADRHGGLLTLVSTAGPLVMFLTRVFRQGLPARSLDSLLIWALVCALDVFLVHPSAEAFPRIVLPLWLRFCALFHIFSVYCGMHALPCTRACHCVLHRPLWPCPCVVCKALASHRDLSPARDWWVMVGLCAALDPWHAVRVSLGSWMHYRVLLGPWCMVVRCEPDMLYDLWWVSYPGVRCQGLLRWLAHAARTYGLGSVGPCLGWGYSAQLWFSSLVTCLGARPCCLCWPRNLCCSTGLGLRCYGFGTAACAYSP